MGSTPWSNDAQSEGDRNASTDLGRDQARTMPRPEYLNNMAKDHLPEIEFWASPLRRTLLTGILSCPEATSWRLVESLREIAGHTLCDSRHNLNDVKAFVKENGPHVKELFVDDLIMDEDTWPTRDREETAELSARCFAAMELMLERSRKTGIKHYVWVSHSAFLSVFLAQLEKRFKNQRFLNNGEWYELKFTEDVLELLIRYRHESEGTVGVKFQPGDPEFPYSAVVCPLMKKMPLEVRNISMENACHLVKGIDLKNIKLSTQAANPDEDPTGSPCKIDSVNDELAARFFFYTSESLAAFQLNTRVNVRHLTIVKYPLLIVNEEELSSSPFNEAVRDKLAIDLSVGQHQGVPSWVDDVEDEADKVKLWNDPYVQFDLTPPSVFEGTNRVFRWNPKLPYLLRVWKIGEVACSHCCLVCMPQKSPRSLSQTNIPVAAELPLYVTQAYLQELLAYMALIQRVLQAPSVSAVFLYDL